MWDSDYFHGYPLVPMVKEEDLETSTMEEIDPGPMEYLVKVLTGRRSGEVRWLRPSGGETIGSDADNDEVNYVFHDETVCPLHAKISFDSEQREFTLRDLESEAGTWIAVRPDRPVELSVGQHFHCGDGVRLQIEAGLPVLEATEVGMWLAAYQLRHLEPTLQDVGLFMLEDLRSRGPEILNSNLISEEKSRSELALAMKQLNYMFPRNGVPKYMLRLVLQPDQDKYPGVEAKELCQIGWAGGVVSFAPEGSLEAPPCLPKSIEYADPARWLGMVPNAGCKTWKHLKFGFAYGSYYVREVHPPRTIRASKEELEREATEDTEIWLRLLPQRSFKLRPGDIIGIGNVELEVLRFNVGRCGVQGARYDMEDEDLVLQDVPFSHWRNCSLFAVYDGHGGRWCSAYLRRHLHHKLMENQDLKLGVLDGSCNVLRDVYRGFRTAFVQTDDDFLTDDVCGNGADDSGSAAVVVCVLGNHLICANVGDSRAVLSRGGLAIQLSHDQKPTREDEASRIDNANGFVEYDRVSGRLALSRAFGNWQEKRYRQANGIFDRYEFLIAEPEILSLEIEPQDEFVLIACDGLWDVFSAQEAVDFVREQLLHEQYLEDPLTRSQRVAEDLVREAITVRFSSDNVTVIIVCLKGAWGRSSEAR